MVDPVELTRRSQGDLEVAPVEVVRLRSVAAGIIDPWFVSWHTPSRGRGRFRYLKVVMRDGEPRPLIRRWNDVGINYHELVLGKDADGEIRIVDVWTLSSGELISETFRQLLIGTMKQADGFVLNDAFQVVRRMANAQNFVGILAYMETLPDDIAEERLLMVLRLQAATRVGEEAYAEAVEDYRQTFGDDDPSLAMLEAEILSLAGNVDGAIAAVDRVDAYVDGDPTLECLRSMIYSNAGQIGAAKAAATRAVERAPDWPDGHWQVIDYALLEQDYDEVLRRLRALHQLGAEVEDLRINPHFDAFRQTPQHEQWQREVEATANDSAS